jgi:WD40 repeat protein/transcriptional regulator with XRE-family HTH domain
MANQRPQDPETESLAGLLLRHRGRTGLTQRELADRLGTSRRSVQDWETGATHPGAERLQALILVLLELGALTAGREAAEALELWAAALREAPRMRTPLDELWLDRVMADRAASRTRVPTADLEDARSVERQQDWGEAPDVIGFVGRAEELATLHRWVLEEHCRLAAVLGMGGIGKTALASRLALDAAPGFEFVYWRSLRDAPRAGEWMAGAISFLSAHHLVPPEGEASRLAVLLELLRERPSLLVLDNFETVLEPGQQQGRYRDGFVGYGELLHAIGERRHQSCLMVTSREAPPELAIIGSGAVHRLQLGGLGTQEAQVLLADKQLSGSMAAWLDLIAQFGGNGLALKIVGESIRQLFDGDVGAFLDQAGSTSIFGGIRRLLAEQIGRSSPIEQKLLRSLAIEREPLTLAELTADLGARIGRGAILEAVEALRRRSLVERLETAGAVTFTLQSVVLEYVTDRVVEDISDEIAHGAQFLLTEQPIVKAQAKDYVRQSQELLIGEPVLQRLRAEYGDRVAEQWLMALLEGWRDRPPEEQGYGPGSVVNLLRLQRGHLRGLDLSRLSVRQGYLAGVEAQNASLAGAHFADGVLAEAFDFPGSVALSGDGTLLAVGTSTGKLWLWRVADRTLVAMLEGHTGVVWSLALSKDGRPLVSGGGDGTVRLWDALSGRLLATLEGHAGVVWAVALSADGQLVASGGGDGTVRLWDASTGRPLATFKGHRGAVRAVALSADGQFGASGGQDGTVRLWQASTGQLFGSKPGHTPAGAGHAGGVWGVAVSADGRLVASGGQDGTVRLWEAGTGQLFATLQGHTGGVWSVALCADGQLIASGGGDGTVRLWEAPFAEGDAAERWAGRRADIGHSAPSSTRTEGTGPPSRVAEGDVEHSTLRFLKTAGRGRPLATLQGHTGTVWGARLSADGRLLASAGGDGRVRLWEARTGRPLATLRGHASAVRAVAVSADGRLVASGGQDATVRVWDATSGRLLASLHGHTGGLWGVALSADAQLAASGSGDGTVRLWDLPSGRARAVLHGHTGGVWSLALSADCRRIASGGEDGTVRLWEASTGRLLATLRGHTGAVASVALSADGELVSSGGADGTLRLWQASTAQLVTTLHGHTSAVWGVALELQGRLLASGSEDGTVRLWDPLSGRSLATLAGHTGVVYGVALAADGELLVNAGADGTVRLWDIPSGRALAVLQGHAGVVRGVALSADGHLVASGGLDETVRLWDARTGTCLHVLRSARPYEGMDITGLSGVTAAQRGALLSLGAIDRAEIVT